MRLTFLGAAETVTGSKFLLDTGDKNYLVDCGLFQGTKELRERNWKPLPVAASRIDGVLLTHAHIDHSGYIPRLVKDGFEGRIYCSEATRDLAAVLLPDSGHIQEDDAEAANRFGYTRHKPALPLYTEAEARASLDRFETVGFGVPHALPGDLTITLSRAGHILGSSFIEVTGGDHTPSILFSGDIGRRKSPVMRPPARMQRADYLVVESTYGDRLHADTDPAEEIADVIRRTAARGGTVVVPAFAVGRTQDLLFHLFVLKRDGRIPDLPVFMDSPMAINVTELLVKHRNEHRLTPKQCAEMCAVARYARTVEESKAISASPIPKVILSASGMATGGRVLHHLKQHLGDARNTVLLAGYQAPGTRGDRLARGEPTLKIHGVDWSVRSEIVQLQSMSAHADHAEILDWLADFREPPRKVFVTHGEPAAAAAMRDRIAERFGWDVAVARDGATVEL